MQLDDFETAEQAYNDGKTQLDNLVDQIQAPRYDTLLYWNCSKRIEIHNVYITKTRISSILISFLAKKQKLRMKYEY